MFVYPSYFLCFAFMIVVIFIYFLLKFTNLSLIQFYEMSLANEMFLFLAWNHLGHVSSWRVEGPGIKNTPPAPVYDIILTL